MNVSLNQFALTLRIQISLHRLFCEYILSTSMQLILSSDFSALLLNLHTNDTLRSIYLSKSSPLLFVWLPNSFIVRHKNTQRITQSFYSYSKKLLHKMTLKCIRDLNNTGLCSEPDIKKSLIYNSSDWTYGKLIFISIKVVQIEGVRELINHPLLMGECG